LEERAHTLGEHRHEFIMRCGGNEINRSMLLCSRDFLLYQVRKAKLMLAGRCFQRTTSTGTLVCVNTFRVSLPSRTAAKPLRPWDVINMRSQPFVSAVRKIAS
jgi:hypothetical protein